MFLPSDQMIYQTLKIKELKDKVVPQNMLVKSKVYFW